MIGRFEITLDVEFDFELAETVLPTIPGAMSLDPHGEVDASPPIYAGEQIVDRIVDYVQSALISDRDLRSADVALVGHESRRKPAES